MEEPAEVTEARLDTFKEEKCKAKTNFNRARRKLLTLIDDECEMDVRILIWC